MPPEDDLETANKPKVEPQPNIDKSTSELDEELTSRTKAEERLTKLGYLLEIAESKGIEVECARDNYLESRNMLYKNKDAFESITKSDQGLFELSKALNKLKFKFLGIPKWIYMSFVMAKYGLFPMLYGMLSAIVFGYLLFKDTNIIIISVPIWAVLIAGLGASAQIMVGTVGDIKATGVVQEYKRLWYTSLPFLAAIFGYIAYILTDLGMITTTGQGTPSNYLNATNIGLLNLTGLENAVLVNNSTLNATSATQLTAQNVASFSANIGDNSRMAVCFIVGFATNAFIEKLTKLSEKL
jgi:hypothetical protein